MGSKGSSEKVETEHPALTVFVVLKHIFHHLSDSELEAARLVNRNWNFTATSELISRGCQLSTIKLYSHSSNQFYDRDYSWYLDFESSRRSLWTDLYGVDGPILVFRHLHFIYPAKICNLFKILHSPWLESVTSLTLSVYSETCQEIVINWFAPALPSLQNLTCLIKPEHGSDSTFNDFIEVDYDLNKFTTELEPRDSSERTSVEHVRKIRSKLHLFTVCFQEPCNLPWILLDFFPEMEDLKLEFIDVACLVKSAECFPSEKLPREIGNLQITLTQKPNLQEQVEETELIAETYATANAKICNLFRVRQSLNVASIIPAASFLRFLQDLTATLPPTQIKFEIATPCIKLNENLQLRRFITYLIPEIYFRFPNLNCLHLQYIQYFSKIHLPIHIWWRREIWNCVHRLPQWKLKQLHISTTPAETEPCGPNLMYLPIPICQQMTVIHGWLNGLVELVVHIGCWEDCVVVLNGVGTKMKSVKKLVLRGYADGLLDTMLSSVYFFPELNRLEFPKDWYYGNDIGQQYQGLPALKSLQVLCFDRFGVYFLPSVPSEILKMPRLKSIHLDPNFNMVTQANSNTSQIKREPSEMLSVKWPSSVGHVQILTKICDNR